MTRGIVVAGMLLALGLSGTAEALDSYQSEISLELLSVENTGFDVGLRTVSYRFYFESVDGSEGPVQLQPFLQKSSWAEISIAFGEEKISKTDASGFAINARYVIPDSVVGIDFNYENVDQNNVDMYSDLRLGAVIWLNDDNSFAIEAGLTFGTLDFITSNFTVFDVGVRYIMPIEDFKLEIAGRYKSIGVDLAGNDASGIEVETRFFFTDDIFAGFSISTVDAAGVDTSNWSLSGGYTFDFGLDVTLRIGDGSAPWGVFPAGDDNVIALEVGYRF